MFPPSVLEAFPGLTLADFIAANCMFENTFSFGYMKPMIERRFLERQALRYPQTLRIGEDYVFLASALARGGRCAVEPQPRYAYHMRAGSISRVLELHHVEAMLAADAAFLRDHRLDAAALAAQARRTHSLEEAAAFLSLVQHIKDRALLKALAAAMREPAALRHLRMPLAVRLKRLARAFEPKALGQSA
jgi:succinoglycan biosynthesis protein ExoO